MAGPEPCSSTATSGAAAIAATAAAAEPGSLGWESSEIPGSACALTLEIAGSPHSGQARKMRQPRRS